MLTRLIFLIADIYTYCWDFQPQYPKYIDSDKQNQCVWCLLSWFSWLLMCIYIADIFIYNILDILIVMGRISICDACTADFADCIYICFYSWYFQPQYPKYIDSDEDNQQCLWCLLCWFSWLLMCIYIAVIFSYNIPNILVVMRGISVCDACSADFADCIYLYIFLIFSATIL